MALRSEAEAGTDGLAPDDLKNDARWMAVERIVASRSFNKSPRLSSFLLYVCDRALRGRLDEINEQQVGVHVFGRAPDYNPASDNIVRGSARQLRQRLALYYQEEGQEETIRLTLPRGGYVPVFEAAENHVAEEEAAAPVDMEPAPELLDAPASGSKAKLAIWALLFAVLAAGSVAAFLTLRTKAATPAERFWTMMFAKDRKTFMVPTDSGLVMVQQVTKHPVHVSDYAIQGYRPTLDPGLANDSFQQQNFGTRKYTSIADLKMAARLARLPQLIPASFEIRFGRDLRIEDLKHSNAILVGGPQGNPWVELFDKDLNFSIESDDFTHVQIVVNRAPKAGELSRYVVQEAGQVNSTVYSIVSLNSNLDHSGRVLTIAGTTMAGIDAATEFLFNDEQFSGILREAEKPDGSLRRFEVLLGTSSISWNALNVNVLAKRFRDF